MGVRDELLVRASFCTVLLDNIVDEKLVILHFR